MESSNQKLGEFLYLLDKSYSCKNNSELKKISNLINTLSENCDDYLDLLFKGLSLNFFNNKEISLELHQCMSINLKNTIIEKKEGMNKDQLLNIFQKIFQLFFLNNTNPNLSNNSIIIIFENIIKELSTYCIKPYLEDLFSFLSKDIKMIDSTNFINISKIVLKFSRALFNSKVIDKDKRRELLLKTHSLTPDQRRGIIFLMLSVLSNVPCVIQKCSNIF